MFEYKFLRFGAPDSRQYDTLEEAVRSAIDDIGENEASPVGIFKDGVLLKSREDIVKEL